MLTLIMSGPFTASALRCLSISLQPLEQCVLQYFIGGGVNPFGYDSSGNGHNWPSTQNPAREQGKAAGRACVWLIQPLLFSFRTNRPK